VNITQYRVSAVVCLGLLLLAGCQGNENSVTGTSSGTRFLSGEVQMVGNLAGASPAGVSVMAQGQVATTDGAGRFAFMGLNEGNVQMAFSRADGISASGNVSSVASAVVVELQKSQATIRETGQSKREIEGLITAISPGSITVNDASTGGPVTATIVTATVIRHGNTTMTTDQLKVGDRVHVKASVASDGTLTAFEIMVQNQGDDSTGDGGQTKELEGLITAVSDSSITVMNASTGGPVTAAITKDTVIRKGNTRLKASDLKVGDRVHVKTTGSGDALTATEIMLQNPA